MKIEYHANARIPSLTANSVQIMKMCAALAAHGHDVTLTVPRFDGAFPDRALLESHYGVTVNFRLRWLRGWRLLGRRWFEARAAAYARRAAADLYITRNERLAALLSRMQLPVVLEIHQPPRKPRDARALKLLAEGNALRTLVVISDALRHILLEQFPTLRNTRIIVEHDGVDLARFDPPQPPRLARAQLGWQEERLTVGYAGHLYAGRGIELILDLALRFPALAFKVMGGEAAAIEHVRAQLTARSAHNVALLGFIPNVELPRYLYACDILLMPYGRRVAVSGGGDTAAFASPLKMFEYMAAARLIVASRLPGVLEVLNDNNALLCEPDNIDEWAAALQRAHDDDLRDRLSAQARADVEWYAWERRAQRIIADAS